MIVDVKLPEQEPILILNAVIETYKPVTVNVSKGLGILDTGKIYIIENAVVEIFQNGSFKERLTYTENGNYISNLTIPQYGNKYKIVASAPGFTEVFAETDIPSNVKISNIIVKDSATYDFYNLLNASVSFTLHDPLESNFYMLEMYAFDSDLSNGAHPIDISASDAKIEFLTGYKNIMFLDRSFYGKEYIIEIFFDSFYLNDSSTMGTPVLLNVSTITQEYYLYQKSVNEQFESRFNQFADPAPVYSNINNGLGILLGKNNNFFPVFK